MNLQHDFWCDTFVRRRWTSKPIGKPMSSKLTKVTTNRKAPVPPESLHCNKNPQAAWMRMTGYKQLLESLTDYMRYITRPNVCGHPLIQCFFQNQEYKKGVCPVCCSNCLYTSGKALHWWNIAVRICLHSAAGALVRSGIILIFIYLY